MTELAKIERPGIEEYKNKKKIYFVRNLYLPKNASEKYREIFYRYWHEVEEHLEKIEAAGKVSKVFCESIYMRGEESLDVLSAMNARLEQLVKKKTAAGAEFLPLEDEDTFGAYIDWSNCLMITRTSRVHERVHKFLDDAVKERFEHIRSVLGENIANGESGLLIMRDEDRERLELPDDFELFFVTPPAYDDLLKYIRDLNEIGKEFWRT
ncbi:MAG: hypothetical protein C4526_01575 [Nitrospiraceae bacterium]|nr:MAG: hypothetical protein C4526_01575 [Nitrospiraceae bacterium]